MSVPLTDARRQEIDALSIRPAPAIYLPPLCEAAKRGEEWRRFEPEGTASDILDALRVLCPPKHETVIVTPSKK